MALLNACFPENFDMVLRWLMELDKSAAHTLKGTENAFTSQCSYNQELDEAIHDLDTTCQGDEETFSEFITRWKNKVDKMLNRPLA